MNTNNLWYFVGIIVGIIAVILVKKLTQKKAPTEYDERQMIIRGKAFTYGYWTLAITGLFSGMIDSIGIATKIPAALAIITSIFISVAVIACYCIAKDAYFGLRSNMKTFIIILLAGIVINVGVFINYMKDGGIIVDGVFSIGGCLNLTCSITLLAILVALLIKNVSDKKEEGGKHESKES